MHYSFPNSQIHLLRYYSIHHHIPIQILPHKQIESRYGIVLYLLPTLQIRRRNPSRHRRKPQQPRQHCVGIAVAPVQSQIAPDCFLRRQEHRERQIFSSQGSRVCTRRHIVR